MFLNLNVKDFFKDELTLDESVILTLAFFSHIKRPLNLVELKEFLWRRVESSENILEVLNKLLLKKKITSSRLKVKNDEIYYTIFADKDIFDFYESNLQIRENLLKRAHQANHLIKWIPFIKGIYLCNSLAFDTAKQSSDIDFFIVTKTKRMFLARAIITLVLSLFNLRRHDDKVAGQVCLSYYVTEDNMDLIKTKITNDIHLVYWIANMKTMYKSIDLLDIRHHNVWIKHYLPNIDTHNTPKLYTLPPIVTYVVHFFLEIILEILFLAPIFNTMSEILQVKRAKNKMKKLSEKAKNIVTDKMLKFHDQDRREEHRDVWMKTLI